MTPPSPERMVLEKYREDARLWLAYHRRNIEQEERRAGQALARLHSIGEQIAALDRVENPDAKPCI